MRWDVVGLVLGWTIGLISIPLMVATIFSIYTEGLEPAARTFLPPLSISVLFGYAIVYRLSLIHI